MVSPDEPDGRRPLDRHEKKWVRVKKAKSEHMEFLWERSKLWAKVAVAIVGGVVAIQKLDLGAIGGLLTGLWKALAGTG